jgi:hypothetical protein
MRRNHLTPKAVLALIPILGVLALATPASAASSVVLARAPYVTDLTSSSAYVNWGIEGSQTTGSVMVVPQGGGACPGTIAWSSKALGATTQDPLVNTITGKTTTPWNYTVVSTTEYQESVLVTGLSPSTPYCYAVYGTRLTGSAQLRQTQSFTTLAAAAGSSAPVSFDVIGDTGEDASGPNAGEQAIYNEIGASGAQFLMIAGDVAYTGGTETDYGDLTQTGSEVSNIFGPSYFPLTNGIPTFVADGNHGQTSDDLRIWPEVQSVASSSGTYSYGPAPAPGVDGVNNDSPSDWYAVQDGNVRIYVLDAAWEDSTAYLKTTTATGSLCDKGTSDLDDCGGYQLDADQHWQTNSTEYKWLKADLAAHPGGVKMAVWHYPIESINETQLTDPYLSNLQTLLEANGVKLVFNGHAHTYQRFSTPNFTSFVTGGGGGTLQPVDGNTDKHGLCVAAEASATVYALGWGSSGGSSCGPGVAKPTSAMQVYNYLHVSVSGSTVTVNAVNALGQTFDTASVSY